MRAIRKVTLWLGVGLLVVVGAAGCDEGTCDACPANPDGVPLCKAAEGSYYGEFIGLSGDCANPDMLNGNARVDVTNILAGVDGDEATTTVEITLTDEQGNNTRFLGTMCDKTEDKAPFFYSFTVVYEEAMAVEGFQIRNQLSGDFIDENGDQVPESITANYSVSFIDPNNPDNTCGMQARLETEPDQ